VNEFVIRKTAELLKKAKSDPNKWHFELEKLKDESFAGISAFRFKVTSGDRLIIVVDGNVLILADIGDHDVMDEYSKMSRLAREEDLSKARPIDGSFKKLLDVAIKSDSNGPNSSGTLNLSELSFRNYSVC
jgi:Txe/YoeB family toxin of Txe-Axe toxin-antitoxin module